MGFPKNVLDELASEIVNSQSFQYNTFQGAKTEIKRQGIEYTYDRLSLACYESNLNQDDFWNTGHQMCCLYERSHSKEDQKARKEYFSLYRFIQLCPQFNDMQISKKNRPDFVLSGENKRIGIEVTEFTTPDDQVMHTICKENFGQGKTAAEIKEAAKRHGEKANIYTYWDIGGSASVGIPLYNTKDRHMHYADEVNVKFQKYSDSFNEYNQFIILGDGLNTPCISNETDADNVIDMIKEKYPQIHGCTVAILYSSDNTSLPAIQMYDL